MLRPLAAALACALALVGVLLAAYAVGPIERLDADALTGFGNLRSPERVPVADFVAHLADPVPLLAMLAGLGALGLSWGRPRHVAAAVFAVVGANVTTQLLKVFLAHPRLQPLGGEVSPVAFPSGHATAAMSVAVAALLVSPRRYRPLGAAAGAAFALAVSLSIVVLDWHYPSDVLGGMLIATGFGFLGIAGVRALETVVPDAGDERPGSPAAGDERVGLEVAAAALGAAALVVGLASAGELLDYARANTAATAAAATLTLASAALVASLMVALRD